MKSLFTLIRCLILAIASNLFFTPAFSQAGSNDDTFNPGTGANNQIGITTIQPDGKIMIGGAFTDFNGTPRKYIARLNSNGSLDETFNPGIGPNSAISTIAIQSDGKIIIGGEFTNYDGTAINCIARLNSDGTLDASFNSGLETGGRVFAVAIQSDGKIIIGGVFTSYNGTVIKYIARLNTDGSLDNTFTSPGTGTTGNIRNIVIQSDGKILINGWFTTGNPQLNIARLNSDGSIDPSFNSGTGSANNGGALSLTLQGDGKIIIGGFFLSYNGTPRKSIARLNTDGTLDGTFNPGTGPNSNLYITPVQSDGKIIIGCCFANYNGIAINSLARLNTDGTLDGTFNPGPGTGGGGIFASALQSDGKIIIGGSFSSYNGSTRNRIARVLIRAAEPSVIPTNNPNQPGVYGVYPNPVQWFVTVRFGSSMINKNAVLFNMQGAQMQSGKIISDSFTLNLLGYATGVYVLKIDGVKGIKILKK